MTEIHGRGGTVYAEGEDGEWSEVGTVIAAKFTESIEGAISALESVDWRVFADVIASLRDGMIALHEYWRRPCIYGVPIGHGGVRMRRRKHGGHWAKLDRRDKVPPAWLVKMRHE